MNSWLPPHCINRVWRYTPIIPTSKRLAWAIRDPQKKNKIKRERENSQRVSAERPMKSKADQEKKKAAV